jgi:hypothetical protein
METSQITQEVVSHFKRNRLANAGLVEMYHHPLTGGL